VSYVEAHGTGTPLGDPIELQALAAVLGPNRTHDDPLIVGSVKTNIGHLEAAAGVAGLMKIVLSLQNKRVPAHLHVTEPDTNVPWSELAIKVPPERMPWKTHGHRRIAGVSSFGFSGTNAHVILEEAPDQPTAEKSSVPESSSAYLLPISARSPVAFR